MLNPRVSSYSLNSSSTSRIKKSLSSKIAPLTRSSLNVNTSRSNASLNSSSYAVEESISHVVESFGIPLPVLVTEAVTLAEKRREVSAKLDASSWAWLVCGRSLFIWKYKLRPGQQLTAAPHCRELTLPPSDVAHKADLVCVLPGSDKQVPSVLAVSPEGTIRYWPSCAHDGSSIEINAELHGQECFSLINCQPFGCILATTTNTLLLVTPSGFGKESSLVCRNVTISQGVLSRISRRMTSFIFGAVPNQNLESRLVRVITSQDQDLATNLFILSESSLQKWEIKGSEGEKLIFNHDIDSLIREKFIEHLWGRDLINPHQLQLWLIDMQLYKGGICILASAVNPREPQLFRYALAVINPTDTLFKEFKAFIVISHSDSCQDADDDFVLTYRLIIPSITAECAYVYRNNVILCVPLTLESDDPDKIEFRQIDDHILGAGSFNDVPLFLSNKHGIVCVKNRNLHENKSLISKLDEESASESGDFAFKAPTAGDSFTSNSDDKTSQLKSALLSFCSKDFSRCQVTLNAHFPSNSASGSKFDNLLDNAAYSLSQKTIDDYPVVDPRWAEAVSQDSAVSNSLIIMHQLEDKHKAHQLLVEFLQQSGLWERLSTVSIKGQATSTRHVIKEHSEKLEAAIVLRNLHSQFGNLIDSAIKLALKSRKAFPSAKLTNQDMFYREVSRVYDIVATLIKVEEDHISYGSTQTIVGSIQSTNCVFLKMLRFTEAKADYFQSLAQTNEELTTWNSSLELNSLRVLLMKQHGMTLNRGIGLAQDLTAREAFLQQVMDLTDLILDGYQQRIHLLQRSKLDSEELESIVNEFNEDRLSLISSLLQLEQYERAASLAEKYFEFEVLVRVCEATSNQNRLNRYIIQFADKGFSDFAFNWYLREGKRGKLLSQTAFQQENLKQFLKNHNNLSWLNDVQQGRYAEGSQTLKVLGKSEQSLLSRKKTLLSLSKLMALASELPLEDMNSQIQDLNEEQNLLMYQESLPATVLESYGFDYDSMRVLSPIELIEMYISEENINANEFDFKKALDLLQLVRKDSNEEYERLCPRIWCRAILRDDWANFDYNNDPFEMCSKTIFFQTIELVYNDNVDLGEMLPNVKAILEHEELGDLRENSNFSFLLQAGYEQIMRTMKIDD